MTKNSCCDGTTIFAVLFSLFNRRLHSELNDTLDTEKYTVKRTKYCNCQWTGEALQ